MKTMSYVFYCTMECSVGIKNSVFFLFLIFCWLKLYSFCTAFYWMIWGIIILHFVFFCVEGEYFKDQFGTITVNFENLNYHKFKLDFECLNSTTLNVKYFYSCLIFQMVKILNLYFWLSFGDLVIIKINTGFLDIFRVFTFFLINWDCICKNLSWLFNFAIYLQKDSTNKSNTPKNLYQ